MRGRRHRNFPVRLAVILAAGVACSASDSWAQDRGACITAKVPEAFTLPDGSAHAAGRLKLCAVQAFTPVAELHSVSVDGTGVGLAMSRRAVPEAYADNHPTFLFRRAPDGVLNLVGYVVPVGKKAWSYTMNRSGPNGWNDASSIAATRGVSPTESVERTSTAPKS
jgi:hypothetical protein